MLCCLTLTQLARFPMAVVRGVSVLSTLGIVKIWHSSASSIIVLSWPWWKPANGQSLTEYALMLGVAGGLAWAVWSMFPLGLTELVRVTFHVLLAGWADWLL
jgi:hypothetical protein